jgi:hypothetical protein
LVDSSERAKHSQWVPQSNLLQITMMVKVWKNKNKICLVNHVPLSEPYRAELNIWYWTSIYQEFYMSTSLIVVSSPWE